MLSRCVQEATKGEASFGSQRPALHRTLARKRVRAYQESCLMQLMGSVRCNISWQNEPKLYVIVISQEFGGLLTNQKLYI